MAEQGMPHFDAGIWIGLLAPPGTPAPIVEKLSDAANTALKSADVNTVLTAQGIDPAGDTPADFRSFIAADTKRWTTVVGAAGLGH